MSDYAVSIFWSDEDNQYIAVVPDLRGCSASGDTPEEALSEIKIAKDLWLDVAKEHGDPLPEPRWRPDQPAKAAG